MASTVPDAETQFVPDPDRFGLLFVHGMGEHERGDTLKQFGEPIYTWIDRWLAGNEMDRRGSLRRLSDSSLRLPHAHEPTAPAHALVEIVEPLRAYGANGTEQRVRLLAAEAWWAKEITSPSFSHVVSWGLGLAPWMIVRYFRGGMKGWRSAIPLQQLVSLLVVVLFQFLLLALTVVGVVPMLRPFIASIQQKLTGSLGDPQVMVSSPLHFNAMTERVLQELTWLRKQRCTKIAVIAHSQGTGVAHAALKRDSARVGLFVTFGTAIEKLHVARQVQRNERRLATGALLTTLGVCSLLIAAATLFKTWPLGGYTLERSGYVITGRPWDPYLLGRWLLVGGVALILARQALWAEWERQRRHRWGRGCTVAGSLAIVIGLALVIRAGGAVKLSWPEWEWSSVADWLSTWPVTPPSMWFSVAFFACGLVIAALRDWKRLPEADQEDMEQAQREAFPGWRNWRSWWEWLRGTWAGNLAAVGLLLLGWFPLALVNLSRSDADDAIFLFVLTGLAFCFAAVSVPIADASEIRPDQLEIPRAASDGPLTWRDYWAAADPVPDDALTTPSGQVDFHAKRIHNRDSIIGDHTNYGENQEQFIGDVVKHVAHMAGFPIGEENRANNAERSWHVVERAAVRRSCRVTALSRGWLVGLLGVPVAWLTLGRVGLTYLGIPVRDLLNALAAVLPEVGSRSLDSWLPLPMLGAALVATIGVVWHRIVVAPAWHYWDRTEADFMFRQEPVGTGPRGIRFERCLAGWLFWTAAAIAALAALFAPWLVLRLQDPLNVLPAAGEGAAPSEQPRHLWETIGGGGWHAIVLSVLIAVEIGVAIWLWWAILRALRLPNPPVASGPATAEPARA